MYSQHQKTIAEWSTQSPDNFAKLVQFVLLTIRVPLHRVADDIVTASQGGEEAMSVLYGWKHEAYNEASIKAEQTLAYLEQVNSENIDDFDKSCAMLEYLVNLRGLGVVKAGFVIQLAYGLCGCLDTHNLERFGLSPRAFEGIKKLRTVKGLRKKIKSYVDACYKFGGPESLWNSWCEYVATNQSRYTSAFEVSAIHCTTLGLKG